jgi:hypothetical protein
MTDWLVMHEEQVNPKPFFPTIYEAVMAFLSEEQVKYAKRIQEGIGDSFLEAVLMKFPNVPYQGQEGIEPGDGAFSADGQLFLKDAQGILQSMSVTGNIAEECIQTGIFPAICYGIGEEVGYILGNTPHTTRMGSSQGNELCVRGPRVKVVDASAVSDL